MGAHWESRDVPYRQILQEGEHPSLPSTSAAWEDLLASPRSQTIRRKWPEHAHTLALSWPSLYAGYESLQLTGLPLFLHVQEQIVTPPASEKESYFAGCALPSLTVCIWKEEEVKGDVLSAQQCKNQDFRHVNRFWAINEWGQGLTVLVS